VGTTVHKEVAKTLKKSFRF